MITANILLGNNVYLDKSSRLNNVRVGDNTKIAGNVTIFGAEEHILEIGEACYVGPGCFIEGYNAKVRIGAFVSFAQNVNVLSGSGPNASKKLQRLFPSVKKDVVIGEHAWIGASTIIMPGVVLGKYCVVGANSFVNRSFGDYSIIGGSPAKLIRMLTDKEIRKLEADD